MANTNETAIVQIRVLNTEFDYTNINNQAANTTTTQTFTGTTYAAITFPSSVTPRQVLIVPPGVAPGTGANVPGLITTGTITLKGATGDTGITLDPSFPMLLTLGSSGAAPGLLCSATCIFTFYWA